MTDIMIIIDGMVDHPCAQLNHMTPFDYADCKNMKAIGQMGATGTFSVKAEGFPIESLPCILTLLGVPPIAIPNGRAYLEALSQRIPMAQDNLILRCNLVRVENELLVSSCCEDLDADAFDRIAKVTEKFNSNNMTFCHMGSYKKLLTIKHASSAITTLQCFAPHEHIGKPFAQLYPRGGQVAGELCAFIEESIQIINSADDQKDRYYALLPWGQSIRQTLPSFESLHHKNAVSICATEIVRGFSLAMGMQTPIIDGANADTDTNLASKRNAVIEYIDKADFILLHINGADEAAHRRDPSEKASFLKEIDETVIAPLIKELPVGTGLLICSDHSTLSEYGSHAGDPQPFYLFRKGASPLGNLGERNGYDAISILTKYQGGYHG